MDEQEAEMVRPPIRAAGKMAAAIGPDLVHVTA
jgi:hypothetical protein